MTPQRWKQVEALYHSAREHGVGLLAGTDPDLRREVERLLAQDSEGNILDQDAQQLLHELTTTAEQTGFSGQTVSHYDILEEIGAGGMGVVYKALDTRLGRLVALKFLPPGLSHNTEFRKRLNEEARAASRLDHPNIVVIHDIGETPAGDVFIAMAFHEGVTLRHKIASGIAPSEALRIARQVASGLAKAHEHGILHRDIKPGNIIVAKDGTARIIDFGLARSSDVTETMEGAIRGTPLYMSPEQATGKAVDFRTDLWSLGAVVYEMLAGRPAFLGESQLQVLHAVVHDEPPALREVRPDLPPAIEAVVRRALRKNPAERYASAAEMGEDLSAALTALETPSRRAGRRAAYVVPAAVLILLAAGLSAWLYQRSEKRHWAQEQAPQIARLASQSKPLAAFRLLHKAQEYLPDDPKLAQLASGLAHEVSVRSTPSGASVEIQDYLAPDDAWYPLGVTPLNHVRIPNGYFRWRVSKPGAGEFVGAPLTDGIEGFVREYNFPLDAIAAAPKGMVPVPAQKYSTIIWSLGELGPYDLPQFYMDRFEVTNREFQNFVDQGGYQKREYWKEKFVRDGKELSWEQAMELFHDSAGRPGPSTWVAGHFPEGQGDYPVGGVSWYEASAYAEFAGKSLPSIAQWYLAAPSQIAKQVTLLSNYSAAPVRVGKNQGVGPWGTYDMAGNVAEWCRNESGGGARYQLGGGFNTETTEYFEPGGLPPFHRAGNAGFRCVLNSARLPNEVTAERRQTIRDLAHAKPVPEAIYQSYKSMYEYDRAPLNVRPESVAQDSPQNWRKEKVTFDAAYGKERMTAYVFLPVHVKPPYQSVVFFPSARVLFTGSTETLGDTQFIDYVIQSGRAVIYPFYKGTYDRPAPLPGLDSKEARDTLFQDSKDIGRSLDYLETRGDMDGKKIAYMGVSMGAALGVNFVAVEDRFKALIMLDGGFYNETPLPGTDQADFAPHVKAPTLLVAGRFDFVFLGKDALLRMLGAPAADKRVVLLDTAHDVSEQRADLVREVLAWLDKYLGKVN